MTNTNKILKPKMILINFGFALFFLISFSFITRKINTKITKTFLHHNFPVFQNDANNFIVYDSVAVINFKNYSLYEFEDIHTVQNNGVIIKTTVINRYFLLKGKEKYGYFYDSLNAKSGKKVSTDSILSKKAYYNQTFYFPSIMTLISSKKNQNGYELIEKYKCKSKVDPTYPDTVIVYYTNKMKNVNFTLSKDLDSIKKMKVVKTRAIYNSQFIKGYPNKFPKYEYKFELKQDSISNLEKYRLFIESKEN